MIKATIKLNGLSPISFGKYHRSEMREKESRADYEERTWREKMHYDNENNVFIPSTMVKNCLAEAAKYMGMQIKGKGKSTYTKHFEAGVIVEKDIPLSVKKDKVKEEWVFVPSDGRRGGTTRVEKCFPKIEKWAGTTDVLILDDVITKDVFEKHLSEAGRFIGLGRFRPRNNGYYGRFEAKVTSWKEIK